ncbi:hypothetical protein [Moraxella lacunata]|uniref:hypothetical protein n=1 Tax=Moraxella lacunata TaxID=477 RepID=UPI003EE28082
MIQHPNHTQSHLNYPYKNTQNLFISHATKQLFAKIILYFSNNIFIGIISIIKIADKNLSKSILNFIYKQLKQSALTSAFKI